MKIKFNITQHAIKKVLINSILDKLRIYILIIKNLIKKFNLLIIKLIEK